MNDEQQQQITQTTDEPPDPRAGWGQNPQINAEKFLELIRAGASVGDAARGVGVCRQTAYNRRAVDAAFASAWDEAVEEGTDRAETVLAQCALNAKKDPKYQTSLIFLLKNRRPKQWRDRHEVGLEGGGTLVVMQETINVSQAQVPAAGNGGNNDIVPVRNPV
jgi:hypothetical protein